MPDNSNANGVELAGYKQIGVWCYLNQSTTMAVDNDGNPTAAHQFLSIARSKQPTEDDVVKYFTEEARVALNQTEDPTDGLKAKLNAFLINSGLGRDLLRNHQPAQEYVKRMTPAVDNKDGEDKHMLKAVFAYMPHSLAAAYLISDAQVFTIDMFNPNLKTWDISLMLHDRYRLPEIGTIKTLLDERVAMAKSLRITGEMWGYQAAAEIISDIIYPTFYRRPNLVKSLPDISKIILDDCVCVTFGNMLQDNLFQQVRQQLKNGTMLDSENLELCVGQAEVRSPLEVCLLGNRSGRNNLVN